MKLNFSFQITESIECRIADVYINSYFSEDSLKDWTYSM